MECVIELVNPLSMQRETIPGDLSTDERGVVHGWHPPRHRCDGRAEPLCRGDGRRASPPGCQPARRTRGETREEKTPVQLFDKGY